MAFLIAIDPSLTCSGWALFDIQSLSLQAVGKVRSLSPSTALPQRYADLQDKVQGLFQELGIKRGDVVVCEAETTMRDPRAAFRVEHVRSLFETIARAVGAEVPGRLNPRSVQNEVMGLKGKQLKREIVKATAVTLVQTLYGRPLESLGFDISTKHLTRNQDIVDALLVGHLAGHRIKSAQMVGMPVIEMFKSKTIRSGRRAWR